MRLMTTKNLDRRVLIVLVHIVLIGIVIFDDIILALRVNLRNSSHFAKYQNTNKKMIMPKGIDSS